MNPNDSNDPKSRRHFFKRGLSKAAEVGANVIEEKVQRKAKRWIRPPFSIAELDFLLACTRCDACIDACPHDVIFPLSAKQGIEAISTPALDILNKGCHLCTGWPCVSACNDNALTFHVLLPGWEIPTEETGKHDDNTSDPSPNNSDTQEDVPNHSQNEITPPAQDCPPFAKAHVNTEVCLPWLGPECGACKGTCPIPNTLIWHNEKPEIIKDTCVGCGLCREACIATPNAIDISTFSP